MSVYQPKGSPYFHFDFQYKGRRFHGSTGQTTRRKAEAVETAHKESVALTIARAQPGEDPVFEKKLAPTLDEAAMEWWLSKGQYLGKPHDPKDVREREDRLAAAVAYVGPNLRVDQIQTSHIAMAVEKRRGKLTRGPKGTKKVISNCTANREVIDIVRPVIRRALKLAQLPPTTIDWGEVRLPEPRAKRKHFSDDQISRAMSALPFHWRDFARFQSRYGLRLSEMFFSPSDVDVPNGILVLQERKADDDHIMPLLDEDLAMLAARKGRAEAAKLPHLWFRELKTGRLKALTRGGALQAMRVAMTESGLRAEKGARGSHAWRHHAGMAYLMANDGDLLGAQKLLGHRDIKSTMTYVHASTEGLKRGLEKVLNSRNTPEELPETVENTVIKQKLR